MLKQRLQAIKNMPDGDIAYFWSSMVELPKEEVNELEEAIKSGDLGAFLYVAAGLQINYFGAVNIPVFGYLNNGICVPLFRSDFLQHVKLIQFIGRTK